MTDDGGTKTPVALTAEEMMSRRKWRIVRGIIISGWVLTLLTLLSLIGVALYLWLNEKVVPDPLLALVGVATAFLFNGFTSILKDFMNDDKDI